MIWPFTGKRKAARIATQSRAFAASQLNDLVRDWTTSKRAIDDDIKQGGAALRRRSREATQNNDYARKYLSILKTNVIGEQGIGLQARSLNRKNELDRDANKTVEAAWTLFGKSVDVTGRLTMVEAQALYLSTVARDGECMVREIVGFPNAFGYALQFLDMELLDEQYNEDLKSGNQIRMSIEFDKWRRPVAYHITQPTAGGSTYYASGAHRIRIPASEMIHGFRAEYAHQSRGFSWLCSALVELHHLGKFREAAIIASRLGASNMGFFFEEIPETQLADGKSVVGDFVLDAAPGSFRKLPRGISKFEKFDSNYPEAMVADFVKQSLKGIASGLNVSYNELASDPEGTSYGTLRSFSIAERDYYRTLQNWVSSTLLARVYPRWLAQSMLTGAVNMPADRYEKLLQVKWQPRGWQWMDPFKDAAGYEKLLGQRLIAPSQIAAEQGRDFDEVCQQIAADQATLERHGLSLPAPATT